MADIKDLDLYGLLELTIDCSEQDIRSAYRKKALKCHPDKNPDDKKAIETFHLLSKAIEVLLDKSARAAQHIFYANVSSNIFASSDRTLVHSSKKNTNDIDYEEAVYVYTRESLTKIFSKYGKINILVISPKKRGSALLEFEHADSARRAKLYELGLPDTDDYTRESLTKIFSKYGKINILVISPKKQGSALLEFEHADSARRAKLYELGLPNCPLTLNYLNPDVEREESRKQPKNPVFSNIDFSGTRDSDSKNVESSNGSDSDSTPNLFPSANKSSNIFPSADKSSNLFPTADKSSHLFPIADKSSNLFPSADKSSNIFSSSSKPRNVFPSGLFPSANVSSNIFACSDRTLVLSSKKNTNDLDYEEAVLNQMRKAQEKQT
ncbi:dnaJ homolog subfamily C member 17-like [Diaphorina citri]|uniref:DnaJ homolog subfamily C member 17-like n=1 Tax=Diaphorina citri TaxID=121845 RepID=A0A3Q0IUI7_DIACI|nr:dnaJ homolog subfamily C member 17-like [Diaphorina citri]